MDGKELNDKLDREDRRRRAEVTEEDIEFREKLMANGICWLCEKNMIEGWNGQYLHFCRLCAREMFWTNTRNFYRKGKKQDSAKSKAQSIKYSSDFAEALGFDPRQNPGIINKPYIRFTREQIEEQRRKEMAPLSEDTLKYNRKIEQHKIDWIKKNDY